jgi:hypothetical protein
MHPIMHPIMMHPIIPFERALHLPLGSRELLHKRPQNCEDKGPHQTMTQTVTLNQQVFVSVPNMTIQLFIIMIATTCNLPQCAPCGMAGGSKAVSITPFFNRKTQ